MEAVLDAAKACKKTTEPEIDPVWKIGIEGILDIFGGFLVI